MGRLAAAYTLVARVLLGALVAVVLVNVALYPFPSLRRSAETPTPITGLASIDCGRRIPAGAQATLFACTTRAA